MDFLHPTWPHPLTALLLWAVGTVCGWAGCLCFVRASFSVRQQAARVMVAGPVLTAYVGLLIGRGLGGSYEPPGMLGWLVGLVVAATFPVRNMKIGRDGIQFGESKPEPEEKGGKDEPAP